MQISDDEENSQERREENGDYRTEISREQNDQNGTMQEQENTEEEKDIPEIEIDQAVVENVIIHFPSQGSHDIQPVIERVVDGTVPEDSLSFDGQPVIYHQVEQHVEPSTSSVIEETYQVEQCVEPSTSSVIEETYQVEQCVEPSTGTVVEETCQVEQCVEPSTGTDIEAIYLVEQYVERSTGTTVPRETNHQNVEQPGEAHEREHEHFTLRLEVDSDSDLDKVNVEDVAEKSCEKEQQPTIPVRPDFTERTRKPIDISEDQPRQMDTSDAGNSITVNEDLIPDQVDGFFRNIHACIKNQQSLRCYTWLCEMDEAKGSISDLDESYYNYKQGKLFMKYIAKRIRKDIVREVKKAHYFSLLVDSEKGQSYQVQFSVRLRGVKNGVTREFFMSVKNSESAATGADIWTVLRHSLEEVGITHDLLSKMTSIYLDGICVENNQHLSVAEVARKVNSCTLEVCCMGSRLEQSLWNQGEPLPLFKKVYVLLHGLFNFYESGTRQRLLLQSAAEAEKMDFIPPSQVLGPSWIKKWVRALKNIQEGHKVFCRQLRGVPLQQGTDV